MSAELSVERQDRDGKAGFLRNKKWGFRVCRGSFWEIFKVWPFDPPLRRFEHDFAPLAGLTLSDPARRLLRAGRSQSSRHLGRQSR
jgi:hypothetical protein